MDVAQITDITQLQALAWQNEQTRKIAETNIAIIENRIRELDAQDIQITGSLVDPLTITAEPADDGEATE